MSWLPLTSTTVAPARLDIARWASGGIILSSTAIRYELGFALHAGSLILPLRADRDYSARLPNRELVSCCFPNRSCSDWPEVLNLLSILLSGCNLSVEC